MSNSDDRVVGGIRFEHKRHPKNFGGGVYWQWQEGENKVEVWAPDLQDPAGAYCVYCNGEKVGYGHNRSDSAFIRASEKVKEL